MHSRLTDNEGEGKVDHCCQALPGGASLQGLHFGGVQPSQRTPRPALIDILGAESLRHYTIKRHGLAKLG